MKKLCYVIALFLVVMFSFNAAAIESKAEKSGFFSNILEKIFKKEPVKKVERKDPDPNRQIVFPPPQDSPDIPSQPHIMNWMPDDVPVIQTERLPTVGAYRYVWYPDQNRLPWDAAVSEVPAYKPLECGLEVYGNVKLGISGGVPPYVVRIVEGADKVRLLGNYASAIDCKDDDNQQDFCEHIYRMADRWNEHDDMVMVNPYVTSSNINDITHPNTVGLYQRPGAFIGKNIDGVVVEVLDANYNVASVQVPLFTYKSRPWSEFGTSWPHVIQDAWITVWGKDMNSDQDRQNLVTIFERNGSPFNPDDIPFGGVEAYLYGGEGQEIGVLYFTSTRDGVGKKFIKTSIHETEETLMDINETKFISTTAIVDSYQTCQYGGEMCSLSGDMVQCSFRFMGEGFVGLPRFRLDQLDKISILPSQNFDVIDATIHLTSSDGEVWNGRLTQAGGGGDDDYQFVGEGRSVNTYMHERIYPISLNPPFQ